jgi:hypothetical protein
MKASNERLVCAVTTADDAGAVHGARQQCVPSANDRFRQ